MNVMRLPVLPARKATGMALRTRRRERVDGVGTSARSAATQDVLEGHDRAVARACNVLLAALHLGTER